MSAARIYSEKSIFVQKIYVVNFISPRRPHEKGKGLASRRRGDKELLRFVFYAHRLTREMFLERTRTCRETMKNTISFYWDVSTYLDIRAPCCPFLSSIFCKTVQNIIRKLAQSIHVHLDIPRAVNKNRVEFVKVTECREIHILPRSVNCERGSRCFIQPEVNFTCLQSRIIRRNWGRRGPTWADSGKNFSLLQLRVLFIFISACLIAKNRVRPCLSDTGEIHDVKHLPTPLKNEEPNPLPTYIRSHLLPTSNDRIAEAEQLLSRVSG